MKVRVFNIEYDTDGENVSLPNELIIDVNEDEYNDEDELSDILGDKISKKTNYLVNGFNYVNL